MSEFFHGSGSLIQFILRVSAYIFMNPIALRLEVGLRNKKNDPGVRIKTPVYIELGTCFLVMASLVFLFCSFVAMTFMILLRMSPQLMK